MIEELGIAAVGVALAYGIGMKIYRRLKPLVDEAMEDGELSLSEALEIVEEAKDIAEELQELPSPSALRNMRKAELIALGEKHGVDVEGTKAEIIERLMEAV